MSAVSPLAGIRFFIAPQIVKIVFNVGLVENLLVTIDHNQSRARLAAAGLIHGPPDLDRGLPRSLLISQKFEVGADIYTAWTLARLL